MAPVSIVVGLLLVLLGLMGYLAPDALGKHDADKTSPTALIPAAVGAILVICGLVAFYAPQARKHVLHLAAAFGLIGALGGFMPLMRGGMDLEKASVRSGILMIILCGVFVALCVRSFVLARAARAAGYPDRPER